MDLGDFDFGKFDFDAQSEAGYVYHVPDPNGVPRYYGGNPVTITVRGSDSASCKNRKRELAREITDKPYESDELAMELLVANTLGWSNVVLDGQPLPFTADNARMLYWRHSYLREKVAGAMMNIDNFFTYASDG